ncbi:MAG TPA: asparagine synthase-related protein [Anaerolineae bacterium]|nr:asparagine synthase-related protein [Anaerolineae bacterium]
MNRHLDLLLGNQSPIGAVNSASRFVVFGWVRQPWLLPAGLADWARQLGFAYFSWEYGQRGTLFLLNSHPDLAQAEEALIVKQGFARTESFEPLSAHELGSSGRAGPYGIKYQAIHGNPLIVSVSRREPAFCVYQSLPSISQIYYTRNHDRIICSDTLRHLVPLAGKLELNPDAAPHHWLYRTIPGEMTYYAGIHKLRCGQMALFHDEQWQLRQAETIDDLIPERRIRTVTPQVVDAFGHQAERLVNAYVAAIKNRRQNLAILLSGGVDSSLMASWVKTSLHPSEPLRTVSYRVHVPSFAEEVRYAQHAIDRLNSEHRFFDLRPEDYPALLEQSIDVVAQPIDNEEDPCFLMLAQALHGANIDYLLSGSDPDCLLGRPNAKRLLQIETLQHAPGARLALAAMERLLRRRLPNKSHGMRDAARLLKHIHDPLSPYHPLNLRGMTSDLAVVLNSFGPDAIQRVMAYRLEVFETYTHSDSVTERVHLNGLTHDVHDEESAVLQFFRAYGLEMVTPYLDRDFIRATLAFEPRIRYVQGGQAKWLPKRLLADRLHLETTHRPKLSGGFDNELFEWMRHGVLRDLVRSIARPAVLSAADFQQLCDHPNWLTWNLLTLDLFQKRVGAASRALDAPTPLRLSSTVTEA